MLLLAGADSASITEKAKESALEIAQSVHALWSTKATGLLVKLLKLPV
ncbi:MAG: hypothetical protein AB7F19_07015 [Candidatus Babeliales bacterium]